jgi:Mannosyltransferase (PIG-V)
MSAIADRVAISAALPVPQRTGVRIPVWGWVIGSRLLVLFAGTWGALFAPEVHGWQRFDPERISSSMGSLGNLLGAASVRWDAISYLTIAQHGYTSARSTAYFPFYPLLIRAFTPPGASPIIAGVLISLVAFAIALELLHRLTRWQLGRRTADATVLLLAFAPFSFVFSAVYTASLLFACAVGTFYLARQGRFVLASIVAACAALSHIEGILLVAPLGLMYWKSRGCPRKLRGLWSASLPVLSLPVLALGGFLAYLHAQGWGWFAPITNQSLANAGRTLVGPPVVLFQSLNDTVLELDRKLHGATLAYGGIFTPGAQNLFYLLVLAIAVLALISAWRRLPTEYALFGALAIIVLTSSAVAMEPLKGIDRYVLPIFPLWVGAAAWVEDRKLTLAVSAASSVLLVLFTIDFTRWISVF